MTDMKSLTEQFGKAYFKAKKAKTVSEDLKKKFFDLATEELQQRRLPQKTIDVPDMDTVPEFVRRYHPGWRLKSFSQGVAVIERDPACIPHSYVNPTDGMLYQRGIQESGPSLDEEKLIAECPQLWKAITKPVREVKDPSTWTPMQRKKVEPYMVPGTIIPKLIAPRPAKPEELES